MTFADSTTQCIDFRHYFRRDIGRAMRNQAAKQVLMSQAFVNRNRNFLAQLDIFSFGSTMRSAVANG